MGFTQKQLEAIKSPARRLLVPASAGSGKTTVMIERVLELLRGGATLDEMVICTFTNASAADMREKLTSALSALASQPWAAREILRSQTAQISTIDGWCQKLVRRYFYALDVDPAFEIIDETESQTMMEEAIEATLARAEEQSPAQFEELRECMSDSRDASGLAEYILKIYAYARVQDNPRRFLSEDAFVCFSGENLYEDILKKERSRILASYKDEARRLWKESCGAGDDRLVAVCEAILRVSDGEESDIPTIPNRVSDSVAELKERVKAFKGEFSKCLKKFDAVWEMPDAGDEELTRRLINLVCDFYDEYEAMKKKRGVLDYADLEHNACTLAADVEIAKEIADECKYLFVDEFQDVNPLQERIFSLIPAEYTFYVGDVKQSIYAFRMCNPDIFLSKCNNYAELGYAPPIMLNHNFRSSGEVIDFTNEVFSAVMTEEYGKINYARDAKLVKGRDVPGQAVTFRVVCVPETDALFEGGVYRVKNGKTETRGKADAEADAVVRDVVDVIKNNTVICSDGSVRPVKYSDIAVLTRSRSEVSGKIIKKLRALGIPVSAGGSASFASFYEVGVLCEFIKYLASSTDEIALLTCLSSPLAALTDDELAEIKLFALPKETFYSAAERFSLDGRGKTRDKLAAFFELAERYRIRSKVDTVGRLIGALVAEKEWFKVALRGEEGAAAALDAFLAHLNVSSHASSVLRYAEYCRTPHSDYCVQTGGDCVLVDTVHASKGLEFPFVFLPDLSRGFNKKDLSTRVICHSRLGVCMRTFNREKHKVERNKAFVAAAVTVERRLKEELMRLLYVAFTRAEKGLYLYASVSEKELELLRSEDEKSFVKVENAKSFYDWLRPFFVSRGFTVTEDESAEDGEETDELAINPYPVDKRRADAFKEYFERSLFGKKAVVKRSVTALMRDAGEENVKYVAGEDDDRAIEKGNAYHRAMELVNFYADFDSEWKRLSEYGDIELLVKKEDIRLAAEIIKEFIGSRRFYREQQFIRARDEQLVQGVIDLLVLDGDRVDVVDYKTSAPARIRSTEYALQLREYMDAACSILNAKRGKAYVYSFALGKLVPMDEMIEV